MKLINIPTVEVKMTAYAKKEKVIPDFLYCEASNLSYILTPQLFT